MLVLITLLYEHGTIFMVNQVVCV